ncbi:MAG: hypothetical protein Q9159_003548 [Coniocarpon cinnabarinum]
MLQWTPRGAQRSSSPPDPAHALERPAHIPTPKVLAEKATQRITFDSRGAIATAWPSEGGILIKDVDAIDLLFLGVSRTDPTPRSNPFSPVQEDQWCAKLRQIAPRWMRNEQDWIEERLDGRFKTAKEIERIFVAWPDQGSGVCVLKFLDGRIPDDFGIYYACISMAERCEVPKKFGAQFYADPNACFELSKDYSDECRKQRDELD